MASIEGFNVKVNNNNVPLPVMITETECFGARIGARKRLEERLEMITKYFKKNYSHTDGKGITKDMIYSSFMSIGPKRIRKLYLYVSYHINVDLAPNNNNNVQNINNNYDEDNIEYKDYVIDIIGDVAEYLRDVSKIEDINSLYLFNVIFRELGNNSRTILNFFYDLQIVVNEDWEEIHKNTKINEE